MFRTEQGRRDVISGSTAAQVQLGAVARAMATVVQGKDEVIDVLLAAILAGGHVLFEDAPGTAKTMLARAFAAAVGLDFRRIQFTADMMPADVTGGLVYDPRDQTFEIRRGPVFGQLVLADEINRANPRAQSALLESMAEGQVTIDGASYALPEPFTIIATQNPFDMAGTYPLPEAQLDRFMVHMAVGYPAAEVEADLVDGVSGAEALARLESVCSAAAWGDLQVQAASVHVSRPVAEYIVAIVQRTREHPALRLGASPRATLALAAISRAASLMRGRDFVEPSTVARFAPFVLAHRVCAEGASARAGRHTVTQALREILVACRAPV